MKQKLKDGIFRKRKSLSKNEVEGKSAAIREKLFSLNEFKGAKNILFYVSFNNEVDTINIIKDLFIKKEKNVLVPYVDKDKLIQISKINSFGELEPKTFGILEPREDKIKKFDAKKLDLVIVPGVVFDENGHRIGYGYGYYDRFLQKLSNNTVKIGLAFELQLIEKIPKEGHDIPVDFVITEKRIVKCKK